jgi:hypothetical protein
MGWRYRKSMRIGPLRINFSRRGVGHSVGVSGLRVTHSAGGQRYLTFTIPGTGWSYRKQLGRQRRRQPSTPIAPSQPPVAPPPRPSQPPLSQPPWPLPPSAPPPPRGTSSGLPDWLDDHLRGGE